MHRVQLFSNALVALAILASTTYADEITPCEVVVGLGSSEPLATVQFTIDYSRTHGTFAGVGADVQCNSAVAGATVSAYDSCTSDYVACETGAGRRLSAAILTTDTSGFAGPREIARCTFQARTNPTALDFDVSIGSASNLALTDANQQPLLDILAVNCEQ